MTFQGIRDTLAPVRIVVGVTGHRHLRKEDPVAKRIPEVLAKIKEQVSVLRGPPFEFTVLSPLAEGADRLVVHEMLKIRGTRLEVILPLETNDYLNDFENPESRWEFEELLGRAERITKIPPMKSRTEAYGAAGRFVVDRCNVLIALWDGQPSSRGGGTAETVEYARQRNRPLFWLNSEGTNELTFEPGSGITIRDSQRSDR